MRTFDYTVVPPELEATPVTNLLLAIREYKGKQALWDAVTPEILSALRFSAQVQSTGASNRIEGIVTTEKRLHALVSKTAQPQNRAEEEILGYRDVLALIHRQHDDIPITPGVILQLHRDMMGHTAVSFGGRWKDSDNQIVSRDPAGKTVVRFTPTPAVLTPQAVEQLCATYNEAYHAAVCDPLLLAARFAFDFVSIHPFNVGNGRMSRLLTVLLMERSGYHVGKYVSIERCIERSKDQYYDALAASSAGWAEGRNNEAPFMRYMLGVVLGAYRELELRVNDAGGGARGGHASKTDRVRAVFERHPGKVTKQMILEECPDISEITVKRALRGLLEEGAIEKVGSGRSTSYVRVR